MSLKLAKLLKLLCILHKLVNRYKLNFNDNKSNENKAIISCQLDQKYFHNSHYKCNKNLAVYEVLAINYTLNIITFFESLEEVEFESGFFNCCWYGNSISWPFDLSSEGVDRAS